MKYLGKEKRSILSGSEWWIFTLDWSYDPLRFTQKRSSMISRGVCSRRIFSTILKSRYSVMFLIEPPQAVVHIFPSFYPFCLVYKSENWHPKIIPNEDYKKIVFDTGHKIALARTKKIQHARTCENRCYPNTSYIVVEGCQQGKYN